MALQVQNLSAKIVYDLAIAYICEHLLPPCDNPQDVIDLYLKPEHVKGSLSLNGIYEHIMLHAQNKGTGGNAIRNVFGTNDSSRGETHPWFLRWKNETTCLFEFFDPYVMAKHDIYDLFAKIRPLVTKPEPDQFVYIYCLTAIQAARFLSQYKTGQEFYADVDQNPEAFTLRLQSITGIGPALAFDLLKELGYVQFVKPDVHIIDISLQLGLITDTKDLNRLANILVQWAQQDQISPFAIDRLLWLIGSASFFHHDYETLKTLSRNKHAVADRRKAFVHYVTQSLLLNRTEVSL